MSAGFLVGIPTGPLEGIPANGGVIVGTAAGPVGGVSPGILVGRAPG